MRYDLEPDFFTAIVFSSIIPFWKVILCSGVALTTCWSMKWFLGNLRSQITNPTSEPVAYRVCLLVLVLVLAC